MVISCFPVTVKADDATLGGTGITVYPINDTDVEMEKEIIDILVKDGKTYVNCQFFFHNAGEKTMLLVGFPTQYPDEYESEEEPDEETEDEYDPDEEQAEESEDEYDPEDNVTQLYRFKTFIHGKRVPVKTLKGLEPKGNNSGDLFFPEWYTWRMTFAAGEKVKVVNRYYMENSYGGENSEWTNYILRSGTTWKGPIGKLTVRMRFEGYDKSRVVFSGMEPKYIDSKGTATWEAENIEPEKDIEAVFSDDSDIDELDSPFDEDTPGYNAFEQVQGVP